MDLAEDGHYFTDYTDTQWPVCGGCTAHTVSCSLVHECQLQCSSYAVRYGHDIALGGSARVAYAARHKTALCPATATARAHNEPTPAFPVAADERRQARASSRLRPQPESYVPERAGSHPVRPSGHCDESGEMLLVRPNSCSFRQYCFAICFHVTVTVAVPIVCTCVVILCAFFLVIVFTTDTIAKIT